jgi:hypothetical protein
LRQRGWHQKRCVPAAQIFLHSVLLIQGLRDLALFLKAGNTKEWQFENSDRRVLVAVITGAELGHFESTDGDAIEVFAVIGQTTIGNVQRKFAVGLRVHQFSQLFHMLCERPAFAPKRNVPLCTKGSSGQKRGQHGCRYGCGYGFLEFHDVLPCR